MLCVCRLLAVLWVLPFLALSLSGCYIDEPSNVKVFKSTIQAQPKIIPQPLNRSVDLETKFSHSGDSSIDLHAKVIWRQVTIFDPETGDVLESHLTPAPVDKEGETIIWYDPAFASGEVGGVEERGVAGSPVDLDSSPECVNGNTIIRVIPNDIAEKIKGDDKAIIDSARKSVIDLGVSP